MAPAQGAGGRLNSGLSCPRCGAARGEEGDCEWCGAPAPSLDALRTEALLAEAAEALEASLLAGEALNIDDLCARYPAIAGELRGVMEMSDALHGVAAGVQAQKPPAKLGQYERREPLGRGGMAPVYLGFDGHLEREVALKLLVPDPLWQPVRRARFLREARALAAVDHPHVVPIYAVGEDGPWCYLAMARMQGTLADAPPPQGNPATEQARQAKLLRWLRQACAALAHCHGLGLLHRDLKPQNLLLDDDEVLRVGDFGLAFHPDATRLTASGQPVGTLRFQSPECARGAPQTLRSEVYALAATFYAAFTGEAPPDPFARDSEILAALAQLPAQPRQLLQRAMHPQPAARFADMARFGAAVDACLEEPDRGRASSGRLLPWIGALAGVALGFGVITGLLRTQAPTVQAPSAPNVHTSRPAPLADHTGWSRVIHHTRVSLSHQVSINYVLKARGLSWESLTARTSPEPVKSFEAVGRRFFVRMREVDNFLSLALYADEGYGVENLPLAEYLASSAVHQARLRWRLSPDAIDVDGDSLPDLTLLGQSRTFERLTVVKWDPPAYGDPNLGWVQRVYHRIDTVNPQRITRAGRAPAVLIADDGLHRHSAQPTGESFLMRFDLRNGSLDQHWSIPGRILGVAGPDLRGRHYLLSRDNGSSLYRVDVWSEGPAQRLPLPGALREARSLTLEEIGGRPQLLIEGADMLVAVDPSTPGQARWTLPLASPLHAEPLAAEIAGEHPGAELCVIHAEGVDCSAEAAPQAPVFQARFTPGTGERRGFARLGDIDGDGRDELAAGTDSGELLILSASAASGVLHRAGMDEPGRHRAIWAPPLVVHEAPGLRRLVLLRKDGWLAGFELDGTGLRRLWKERPFQGLAAGATRVELDGEVGIAMGGLSNWMMLLGLGPDATQAPQLRWSYFAHAVHRVSPLIYRRDGQLRVLLADYYGYIYEMPMRFGGRE